MQDTTNVVVAVYEVRVLVLVVVSQYSRNFPSLKMENIYQIMHCKISQLAGIGQCTQRQILFSDW